MQAAMPQSQEASKSSAVLLLLLRWFNALGGAGPLLLCARQIGCEEIIAAAQAQRHHDGTYHFTSTCKSR